VAEAWRSRGNLKWCGINIDEEYLGLRRRGRVSLERALGRWRRDGDLEDLRGTVIRIWSKYQNKF